MGYRSILITSGVRLSVKNDQLIISGEEEHSVPLEDIRTVCIESRSALITAYTLTALSQNGVCVYLCDDKHLPCAVLQPFAQYSRQKKQLTSQFGQSKPTLKRLWQEIVTVKVTNQAKCLEECRCSPESSASLRAMAGQIRSGDPDNLEARAAALYFRTLFGSGFSRSAEDTVNAALNYGYAVVRGFLARKLADYGFEPCLGIHHANNLNQFNLADDLIEPFRPLVDAFVFHAMRTRDDGLTSADKRELANILNYEMVSGGERHSAAYAAERMIHSMERIFEEKEKGGHLCLPVFEGLRRHEYE